MCWSFVEIHNIDASGISSTPTRQSHPPRLRPALPCFYQEDWSPCLRAIWKRRHTQPLCIPAHNLLPLLNPWTTLCRVPSRSRWSPISGLAELEDARLATEIHLLTVLVRHRHNLLLRLVIIPISIVYLAATDLPSIIS
jgi:hypothetical protein